MLTEMSEALTGTPLMPSLMPSKRKKNAPEVLKVCPRDCFVISTPRNATTNPRYGIRANSEVTLKQKTIVGGKALNLCRERYGF